MNKRIYIGAFYVLFGMQLMAQCNLNLNNITVCNNSAAVLGLGMQLTIASVPSNNLITDFQWSGPNGFSSNQQLHLQAVLRYYVRAIR